jgi:hypothetical protein
MSVRVERADAEARVEVLIVANEQSRDPEVLLAPKMVGFLRWRTAALGGAFTEQQEDRTITLKFEFPS